MNKFLVAVLSISMLVACKSKHKKGGDELSFEDFRELFKSTALPYKLTPEVLQEKIPDSAALSPKLLAQFLTDTLARGGQSKGTAPKFFPLAYIKGNMVDYFVVSAVSRGGATAYLCFTDKKGHYLDRMQVASVSSNSPDRQYFSLDSRNVIKVTDEKQLGPGRTATREDFYTAGADGKVTLIMTNTSGAATAGQLFNPIDTLPRKHKLSGDYTAGEMNLVSIRDGDEPKSFLFFISFSRENGACKGELSGAGRFTGTNKGEYRDKETDCGIAFQFSSSRVSIKEIGGCGAYRGVRCLFEGSFVKKKAVKK